MIHPAWPGEGRHAGLGRAHPVTPRTQKGTYILVNNAGVYPVTATGDLEDGDPDRMLAVNVRAPHVLVAALVPAMVRQGSGAVIMIGS